MASTAFLRDEEDILLASVTYQMDHPRRGFAAIFNNENFASSIRDRTGSQKDVDRLRVVLDKLGFQVVIHKDYSATRLQDQMKCYANLNHKDADCFLAVIMSHGAAGNVVECRDATVNLYELTHPFNDCETLLGKPKLFLIQTCRGEEIDHRHATVSDGKASETHRLAPGPDFFYAFPTTPGCPSYRSTKTGAFFIQRLCDTLEENAVKSELPVDLARLLTSVRAHISYNLVARVIDENTGKARYPDGEKQAPTVESSLRKLLFLGLKTVVVDSKYIVLSSEPIAKVDILSQGHLVSVIKMKSEPPEKWVAIKDVTLVQGEDKAEARGKQISNLDNCLDFLLTLRHPNIVNHLDLRIVATDHPFQCYFYRVIMDFCHGGSLTERITSGVTLANIQEWGRQILEALKYLHDRTIPVSHGALHCDHVMFTGPEAGQGDLKIVSVGQLQEVATRFPIQSHVPPDEKKRAVAYCSAPYEEKQGGRKGDIWAFGCLLAHVVNPDASAIPEIVRIDSDRRPRVPSNLPEPLASVIVRCLTFAAADRPSAADVLSMPFFMDEPAQWLRPTIPRP